MTASVVGAAMMALILVVVETSDGVPACRPASPEQSALLSPTAMDISESSDDSLDSSDTSDSSNASDSDTSLPDSLESD